MSGSPAPIEAIPQAATPAAAPKSRFFRLPRREFFVGGLAGLLVGKAVERVQPIEWTQRNLPEGTKLSYAQFGEDVVAGSLFTALKIEPRTYMDIGAFEPIRSNNTYAFYRRGARGVLVEPNPAMTVKLRRQRPGDVVLEAGIGITDDPSADYYILTEPELNTFDKDQAEHVTRTSNAKIEQVVKMPLLNINRVIAEHLGGAAPDFLSIDVEGLDLSILRTLDFDRHRPKVICAETLVTNSVMWHRPELPAFLATKGYIVRGMTYPNTLFVDERLLS